MTIREEDKDRIRRQLTREAIQLAIQGRWEEAVSLNRSILESFPADVDALNRLGRALMELGEITQAKESYARALEVAPGNSIAQKNLQRLSLVNEKSPSQGGKKVAPQLFIGEMGKSGVIGLINLAPREVLARMVAGEEVLLNLKGNLTIIENGRGEYLGEIEPRFGLRLAKLIKGGNRYMSAMVSVSESSVKIMVRETYQHPSLAGKLSFPVKAIEGFRTYVKEGLLRLEDGEEEEEAWESSEDGGEEEAETLPDGFSIVGEPQPGEEEIT